VLAESIRAGCALALARCGWCTLIIENTCLAKVRHSLLLRAMEISRSFALLRMTIFDLFNLRCASKLLTKVYRGGSGATFLVGGFFYFGYVGMGS
jgi:hypothetical protein